VAKASTGFLSDLEREGEEEKLKGKVRKIVGTVTEDREQEARGEEEFQKGKLKKAVGEVLKD
jgi:uncharacterized protein YjbJ (UPF0337 family)